MRGVTSADGSALRATGKEPWLAVRTGCELPEDLFYDVEGDVWARLHGGREVTLGRTDPAPTRSGKLEHILIKEPPGMTIEVFGYQPTDFVDGIEPVCGAAHFIEYAADADVSIFV